MKMVIVTLTFKAGAEEKSYDMEMPCQVPVCSLSVHICQTLDFYLEGTADLRPQGLQLWCRRLERTLFAEETLEDAGVWNGDHLDIK